MYDINLGVHSLPAHHLRLVVTLRSPIRRWFDTELTRGEEALCDWTEDGIEDGFLWCKCMCMGLLLGSDFY